MGGVLRGEYVQLAGVETDARMCRRTEDKK